MPRNRNLASASFLSLSLYVAESLPDTATLFMKLQPMPTLPPPNAVPTKTFPLSSYATHTYNDCWLFVHCINQYQSNSNLTQIPTHASSFNNSSTSAFFQCFILTKHHNSNYHLFNSGIKWLMCCFTDLPGISPLGIGRTVRTQGSRTGCGGEEEKRNGREHE